MLGDGAAAEDGHRHDEHPFHREHRAGGAAGSAAPRGQPGVAVCVAAPPSHLRWLLDLLGIAGRIPVFRGAAAALAASSPPPSYPAAAAHGALTHAAGRQLAAGSCHPADAACSCPWEIAVSMPMCSKRKVRSDP